MAKRRMFSLDVVDTDNFLDMSVAAQCLYFHLGMRADDDGFVSSPKRIMSNVGCNTDDLRILISKGYIIAFEKGIVVITDWKENNYIRKDRYAGTKYEEYIELLEERNGRYVMKVDDRLTVDKMSTTGIPMVDQRYTKEQQEVNLQIQENNENSGIVEDGIPMVDQWLTQDRIGKDRIGKDRLGEDRGESPTPLEKVVELYNSICVSLPRVTKLSEARKKAIRARLKKYTLEDIERAFTLAEQSGFLKGSNNRNWNATFDWIMNDTNLAKILDGNYADKNGTTTGSKNRFNNFPQRNYTQEESNDMEKLLLQRQKNPTG